MDKKGVFCTVCQEVVGMTEKLQGLLEKIQKDGIGKAEEEKGRIIADARKEAAKIIEKAEAEAQQSRKQAEADAENLRSRAETAIRQAARDVVLKLKEELSNRIENIVRTQAQAAMSPEFMRELILKISDNLLPKGKGKPAQVQVLVSPDDLKKLGESLKGSLTDSFKHDPALIPAGDIGAGLKLGVKDSDMFLDFSDEAVTDLLREYLGKWLTDIIDSEKK